MNRREFIGACAAVAVAPFVGSKEAVCERCGRVHTPFDEKAVIREAAQQMADEIDRRAAEHAYGQIADPESGISIRFVQKWDVVRKHEHRIGF